MGHADHHFRMYMAKVARGRLFSRELGDTEK